MPDRSGSEDERRVRELAALYAVATAINQALHEDDALAGVLDRVLEVLALDAGRIFLLSGQPRKLSLVAARGDPALLDPTETTLTPGYCLCGAALARGEPLHAADAATDPRVVGEGCRHPGQACAAVPLLAKERMLGVMHVTARREADFSEGELALLRSVGAQIGVGIENMRLREEARRAEALGVLLQEMHHRIKNNLQTVADLLSLETANTESPEARKSLRDSISRIKSIAAVHQLLSVEQLRLTDITELARQVCGVLRQHMAQPEQAWEISVEGPAIYLPSKQATALALVLNEMVANAMEHALPEGQAEGRMAIVLSQEAGRITVMVDDNGRGLPEGFVLERNQGLGLRIARTLAEKDLAGALRLERAPTRGTRAVLTFYQ
jgi:two-component sensor histidine kinase/putative methionine-R-sulfoxide reductase with GAF domain